MRRILSIIAAVSIGISIAGCAGTNDFLTAPLHIRCVGKGTTTINAGAYAGTIHSDCGAGFEYLIERGTAGPK